MIDAAIAAMAEHTLQKMKEALVKPQLQRPLPCLDALIAIQKQQQQGVIRDVRQLELSPGECCHKTRLAGCGCPIGRDCPYLKETPCPPPSPSCSPSASSSGSSSR